MLKISPKISNNVKRYYLKNTINGKCERKLDLSNTLALASSVQLLRMPYWETYDIGITTILLTATAKCIKDFINIRKELTPIIKRAKAIKNTNKN